MRLLDLFCGAGGAAMGYYRAGFDEIVGVDIAPQRHYPFSFVQSDALTYLMAHGQEFDAIHASPPCHHYSTGTRHRKNAGVCYPDLLPTMQYWLKDFGRPYVIENVMGARPLMQDPVMLCGSMFNLGVVRHRLFQTNWGATPPVHRCNRDQVDSDLVSVTRHGPPARWYRRNPGKSFNIQQWHAAIGIDWMPRLPLTQAIPPAYTEYLGRQLFIHLRGEPSVSWA